MYRFYVFLGRTNNELFKFKSLCRTYLFFCVLSQFLDLKINGFKRQKNNNTSRKNTGRSALEVNRFVLTPIAFSCMSCSPFTPSALSIFNRLRITGQTVRFMTFLSRKPFSIRYNKVEFALLRTY